MRVAVHVSHELSSGESQQQSGVCYCTFARHPAVPFKAAAFLWTGVTALHRRVFPRGVELVETAPTRGLGRNDALDRWLERQCGKTIREIVGAEAGREGDQVDAAESDRGRVIMR